MARNWYYAAGEEKKGPFDEAQMAALLLNSEINAGTLVWSEGMSDWAEAGNTELGKLIKDKTTPIKMSGLRCSLCMNDFPETELIQIGNSKVCAICKPIMLRKMQEGDLFAGELRYAGFWIRFVAKLIDGIVMQVVALPVTVISFILPSALSDNPKATIIVMLFTLFSWVFSIGVGLAYNAWFLVKYGATPGKLVLKLRVINADGTEKISVGKAIGRFFAEILSGIILYIGYIMAGFDEEKRALHDRICNTRVIHKG